MSPILGIWASAQQGVNAIGDYESIATTTVGAGGTTTVTFSSIPSTYQHLQVRLMARSSKAGSDGDYLITRFNSDSGSNYSVHILNGNGSATQAVGISSNPEMWVQRIATSANSSGTFGAAVIDILDYANTNKNKTIRNFGGYDANGSGRIDLDSGAWFNTSAVTSISFTCGGGDFQQYSSLALYGIKG